MSHPPGVFDLSSDTPWEQRLAFVVDTMREISRQTDPQALVQTYGRRMQEVMPSDRTLSLSRRDLAPPQVRVTRSSDWTAASTRGGSATGCPCSTAACSRNCSTATCP